MKEELTPEQQATNYATMRHIEQVRNYLGDVVALLLERAAIHDQSKLASPEVEMFTEFTQKLYGLTYGTPEYDECRRELGVALEHHYANNRHHPEHFPWHCPICQLQISREAWEDAPQGPNDSGVRYCPRCSGQGVIYESELMDEPNAGINGMNLIDVVEMFCDWKAATKRHADGDIRQSIRVNSDRFKMAPQLVRIFENTANLFDD